MGIRQIPCCVCREEISTVLSVLVFWLSTDEWQEKNGKLFLFHSFNLKKLDHLCSFFSPRLTETTDNKTKIILPILIAINHSKRREFNIWESRRPQIRYLHYFPFFSSNKTSENKNKSSKKINKKISSTFYFCINSVVFLRNWTNIGIYFHYFVYRNKCKRFR